MNPNLPASPPRGDNGGEISLLHSPWVKRKASNSGRNTSIKRFLDPARNARNCVSASSKGNRGKMRHRVVLAGSVHQPGGFELSTVNQIERARPITITNADNTARIYANSPDSGCVCDFLFYAALAEAVHSKISPTGIRPTES